MSTTTNLLDQWQELLTRCGFTVRIDADGVFISENCHNGRYAQVADGISAVSLLHIEIIENLIERIAALLASHKKLVEALMDAEGPMIAWAEHWRSSPAYGEGQPHFHEVHQQIIDKIRAALREAGRESGEVMSEALKLKKAANKADWMQVALNHSYGPPCFHLQEEEGTFCLRAKSWEGHAESCSHKYVSLADLVAKTPDAALLASHKKLVEALTDVKSRYGWAHPDAASVAMADAALREAQKMGE